MVYWKSYTTLFRPMETILWIYMNEFYVLSYGDRNFGEKNKYQLK